MRNYKVTVNGNTYEVSVEEAGGVPEVISAAPVSQPAPSPAPAEKPVAAAQGEEIMAPLPGTVVAVMVKTGEQVKLNQVLLVIETMKMENELVAPRDGTVTGVYAAKGDVLESGKVVITLVS